MIIGNKQQLQAKDYMNMYRDFMNQYGQLTIPTGTNLDYYCGGFRRNGLNVLCAETENGKSYISLQIAYNMSLNGLKVLYFSLENDYTDDMCRLKGVWQDNNTNFDYFNKHHYYKEQFDIQLDTSGDYDDAFEQVEQTNWTTIIAEQCFNKQYDIIFVDGLETLADDDKDLYQSVNKLLKKIVIFSSETTIVMNWQLNRAFGNETRCIDTYTVNDIANSIGVARYSSTMFAIAKLEDQDVNVYEIKSLKIRIQRKSNNKTHIVTLFRDVLLNTIFGNHNSSTLVVDDIQNVRMCKTREELKPKKKDKE